MGLKEALKRFRVPHVETVEEVRGVLDDIEQSYGQLLHYLEQGEVDAASIRGNVFEEGTPATDDIYRWDGSQFVRWSPKYLTAELSANQTANLAVDDHVEFDTKSTDSGHITLSTGTGQANGIFTVPVGTWFITAAISVTTFSADGGLLSMRLRNDATDGVIDHGSPIIIRSLTSTSRNSNHPTQSWILDTASSIDVKLEIDSVSSLDGINSNSTIAFHAIA